MEDHKELRKIYQWTTYGKSGHEEPRQVLVKDIDDEHLENLIPFIRRNYRKFGRDLPVMLDEQEYRIINKIKVPFKFG